MSLKLPDRLRSTIGFRIWIWYSAVFVAIALLFLLISSYFLSTFLTQRDREQIQLKLQVLASRYQAGKLQAISDESDGFLVRLVRSNGTVLVQENTERFEDFAIDVLMASTPSAGSWIFIPERLEEQDFSLLEGKEQLEIASMQVAEHVFLQVGNSSERREDFRENYHIIFFSALIPLFILGGYILSSRTLSPLRSIISSMQSIQAGRLDTRVPLRRNGDELDQLALLFNQMLDRIQRLVEGMRNSLDNVAHDLRTPITRLRAVAESTLQSNSGKERYQEALADCMEETDEILKLLDTLMDISEAETGVMNLKRETVAIPGLIQDTVDLYACIAEEKNVSLKIQCEKEIRLHADRHRLRQALANLVDNAIKYTQPGGEVELAARTENGEALVIVRDNGAGISEEDLPKIWDRLYRGNRTQASKGIGLGLSLVRAIIKAHGGQVEAASIPGRGTTFTLHLPLPV